MSDADQFSGKTSEGACQQNIMLITHSVKNLFGSMSLRNLEGGHGVGVSGFRIELHIKDLNNAIAAAHSSETAVPLTSQVMEMMQSLKADGCAKEDHSALVKFYEKISDTIVKH